MLFRGKKIQAGAMYDLIDGYKQRNHILETKIKLGKIIIV